MEAVLDRNFNFLSRSFVGAVNSGKPARARFGLALGPDLLRFIGVFAIGVNKVEAFICGNSGASANGQFIGFGGIFYQNLVAFFSAITAVQLDKEVLLVLILILQLFSCLPCKMATF